MGILNGPLAALRAVSLLLKNPSLIPLALVPALVTCAISFVGVGLGVYYGDDLFGLVWPSEPENTILYGLWWLGGLIVRLATAAAALLITPWLVMLVGLPLCEPLAARADALLGGQAVEGSLVGELAKTLKTTIGVTVVGLSGAVLFFLLGLIPGLALITAPFVTFVWTPLFLCFDLYDSSLARRQLGFRQKVRTLLGRPVSSISLGLMGTVLLATPVINLLGLPVAVLAGVISVRALEDKDQLAS